MRFPRLTNLCYGWYLTFIGVVQKGGSVPRRQAERNLFLTPEGGHAEGGPGGVGGGGGREREGGERGGCRGGGAFAVGLSRVRMGSKL